MHMLWYVLHCLQYILFVHGKRKMHWVFCILKANFIESMQSATSLLMKLIQHITPILFLCFICVYIEYANTYSVLSYYGLGVFTIGRLCISPSPYIPGDILAISPHWVGFCINFPRPLNENALFQIGLWFMWSMCRKAWATVMPLK